MNLLITKGNWKEVFSIPPTKNRVMMKVYRFLVISGDSVEIKAINSVTSIAGRRPMLEQNGIIVFVLWHIGTITYRSDRFDSIGVIIAKPNEDIERRMLA